MKPRIASATSLTAINLGGLLIVALFILIPIAVLMGIVRYFRGMSEERRKLRLEVSKLAHELESLRGDLTERAHQTRETSS